MSNVAVELRGQLPSDYKASLDSRSLFPLWTSELRELVGVGRPNARAKLHKWAYAEAKALLLKAADLVSIEQAERRVLVLVNPGFDPKAVFSTTPSLLIGMQMIMPGERAPKHRHTSGAARFIVEGDGAFSAVEGEKLAMRAGDLVLTPPHYWHEHGHEGSGPMIWLDLLDQQLATLLDAMYVVPSEITPNLRNVPDSSDTRYRCSGVVPFRSPFSKPPRYPIMVYRWAKVREALVATAEVSGADEPVHLMYVSPETGESALETFRFSCMMLRPGEEVAPVISSANKILHVIEGAAESEIDGQCVRTDQGDVIAVPTFSSIRHRNNGVRPTFILQVDDSPLLTKLGYYEERPS